MIAFLRFVGVLNAAVWFGGAVFFTLAIGPAIFSAEMLNNFQVSDPWPRFYAGLVAQVMITRYFHVQLWCAGIAFLHLLAEWLYTGRRIQSLMLYLLGGLLAAGLIGGFILQPRIKALHVTKYDAATTPVVREQAAKSFSLWHGVSQTLNLLVIGGLAFYLWRTANPSDPLRFIGSQQQFRG
ncbi:MAG: DUF4149 domain-containing protein [Verrucomicrobia bacterium]|nr:DUF4149 domain-containing protein [Verrucomicrobiota bacterium]